MHKPIANQIKQIILDLAAYKSYFADVDRTHPLTMRSLYTAQAPLRVACCVNCIDSFECLYIII